LLSIFIYKLPWSRPEKKNFFKSAVSVNNSVIDTAAYECLSLLFAAGWKHSRATGGARVPWHPQILADKFQPTREGSLCQPHYSIPTRIFQTFLRPCILTTEPSDFRQCSERFQVEMIAVCAINN
jgi:hypothetical protein